MQIAAHEALPDSAAVDSSAEMPPTSPVHFGLNFAGRAGKGRKLSLVDSADIGTYHSVYFYVCCEGLRGWTST